MTGQRIPRTPNEYFEARFRKKLAEWMIENSFMTGHGNTVDELLNELSWQIQELRARLGVEPPLFTTPESKRVVDETTMNYRDAIRSLAKR